MKKVRSCDETKAHHVFVDPGTIRPIFLVVRKGRNIEIP